MDWGALKDTLLSVPDLGIDGKSIKKLSDSSIVSYALRTKLLGKLLKVVEVPHGNLNTIVVRSNSLKALKESIIKDQPPLYPGVYINPEDIQASVFTPPHFSEPLTTNFQCRCLDEGSYILWTKMDLGIPKSGIDLRSFSKETFAKMASDKEIDDAIQAITYDKVTPVKQISLLTRIKKLFTSRWKRTKESDGGYPGVTLPEGSVPTAPRRELTDISQEERTLIVDILIDGVDKDIVLLASKYKRDPSGFRWHAVNLLRTRKGFNGKLV